MVTVSFRLLLASAGFIFVAFTGSIVLFITWNSAMGAIEPTRDKLRSEVITKLSREILGATNGVQQLSMRGAKGPIGRSMFGCCSETSDYAQSLEQFHDVRQYHWANLETNPHLLLSYSGTMAGSLVLYFRTSNMDDIDGTKARQGRGNMQWTLSDRTTQYRYHNWYSNSWQNGQYIQALTSTCGASQIDTTTASKVDAVASKSECEQAAKQLFNANSVAVLSNSSVPKGCITQGVNVMWNPSGTTAFTGMAYRAVCKSNDWFKRDVIFQPNCTHKYPCTTGKFVPYVEEGFVSSRFEKKTSLYNATVRSWWKGAKANGDRSGSNCKKFPHCREQPGWSTVYLSKSAGELVLPSVYPLYVGNSDTLRSVITLCIGLRFLDQFIQNGVQQISADSQGWIIDLHPSPKKLGALLASSPMGLSTSKPQTETSSGDLKATFATTASGAGPEGVHIEAVSKELAAYAGGWRGLPDEYQMTYKENDKTYLVQSRRLYDKYGLEWLLVLSVPEKVFVGDLPKARDTTIGVVVALTLGVASLLFALTCCVSKHIISLSKKMAKVAKMEMDGVNLDKNESVLTEVTWMETSFRGMSNNLKELWQLNQARLEKLEKEREQQLQELQDNAIKSVREIGHPMVLIGAKSFTELTEDQICVEMHEGARNTGKLMILDSLDMVRDFKSKGNMILFITYEWLSWKRSGPSTLQYQTMMSGVKRLQKELDIPWSNFWIWLDVLAIPQVHPAMKHLAVYSLYSYAGQSDILIVIAPDETHCGTGLAANVSTVRNRVWTRTEQTAHACTRGLEHLYIYNGKDLTNANLDWFKEIVNILDGQMTCCRLKHPGGKRCDKESLVLLLLGMYFDIYTRHKMGKMEAKLKPIWEYLLANKAALFPKTFEYASESGMETKNLFGEMVERLEAYVNGNPESALANTSWAVFQNFQQADI